MPRSKITRAEFESERGERLWPAEEKIFHHIETGDLCEVYAERALLPKFSDEYDDRTKHRPIKRDDENRVDASFLRAVILNEFSELTPHSKGLRISGVWVDGMLDLEYCKVKLPIVIWDSVLSGMLSLLWFRCPMLNLDGSRLFEGLDASGSAVGGGVFLRNGFNSKKMVRFVGAKIGGQFNCSGGEFQGEQGRAFVADGVSVDGDVLLRNRFTSDGEISFRGAKINEDFDCIGGHFFGAECVIDLGSADIGERLMLRQPRYSLREEASFPKTTIDGTVDLQNARCRVLVDDALSQSSVGFVPRLSGFVYDQIDGPTSFDDRRKWLLRQPREDIEHKFKPQPFEQLSRVLRTTGHEGQALRVALFKHRQSRRAKHLRDRLLAQEIWRDSGFSFQKVWRRFFAVYTTLNSIVRSIVLRFYYLAIFLVFQPAVTVAILLLFVWIGSLVFEEVHRANAMVPNNPFLLRSEKWVDCLNQETDKHLQDINAIGCWLEGFEGHDFQRFEPIAYSLDVFLPLFDLHQESNWIPQPERGVDFLTRNARLYQWFHTALGYLLSVLAVAGFTGIVKKE